MDTLSEQAQLSRIVDKKTGEIIVAGLDRPCELGEWLVEQFF